MASQAGPKPCGSALDDLGDGIAGSTSFGDLGAGTIITNNGTLLVSPGYAVGTAFARTVNNNGNVNFYWTNGGFNCDFTTVINGSGTVTKDGPSRAWLKSASGYTGNTTNRAGILDVTGDSALGGAGGKIVFAAGGTARCVSYSSIIKPVCNSGARRANGTKNKKAPGF